jgi:hypothetical protein
MRDEIKQAILGKNSFLIYGPNVDYSIDIFDELIKGLEDKHEEIFYFDTIGYGIKPKFTKEIKRVKQQYDLFWFFKEKKNLQIDFDSYITDICNCLHAEMYDTKVDGQNYLIKLLKDVYQSEDGSTFDIYELKNLLENIINATQVKIDKDFFNILDRIDSLKAKNPKDFFADPTFNKLAREARLILERHIFDDPSTKSYSKVASNNSNYSSAVKYFTTLLGKMKYLSFESFSNEVKMVPGKINDFEFHQNRMRFNYIGMVLSSIVRKLKIYNSPNKPLVIINGKQKDLLDGVQMGVGELLHRCTVCFIINSGYDLDRDINASLDVKIFSSQHKNLSLSDDGIQKRIENGYIVQYKNS